MSKILALIMLNTQLKISNRSLCKFYVKKQLLYVDLVDLLRYYEIVKYGGLIWFSQMSMERQHQRKRKVLRRVQTQWSHISMRFLGFDR